MRVEVKVLHGLSAEDVKRELELRKYQVWQRMTDEIEYEIDGERYVVKSAGQGVYYIKQAPKWLRAGYRLEIEIMEDGTLWLKRLWGKRNRVHDAPRTLRKHEDAAKAFYLVWQDGELNHQRERA